MYMKYKLVDIGTDNQYKITNIQIEINTRPFIRH